MAFAFERLRVYGRAEECLGLAYRVAALLPESERFNLAEHLRRSALSVVLNLVESTERRSSKDAVRFIGIALGSLVEAVACLRAVRTVGHPVPSAAIDEALATFETLYRQLHAYRRARPTRQSPPD